MHEKTDRAHFLAALEAMVSRYPGAKWDSGNENACWFVLQIFHLDDVLAGIRLAADKSPRYLPPAGMIREEVLTLDRARRQQAEEKRKAETEKIQAKLHVNPAPSNPSKAVEYVKQAKDPFEWLARKWEADSKRLGIRPEQTTPIEIAKERFREFWEMWARVAVQEFLAP